MTASHDPSSTDTGPPERRVRTRRAGDEDKLDPSVLLGYERWAGQIWRHRGKVAAAIGMTASLAGCVVGYLGRAHDLDAVKARITADSTRLANVEVVVSEQAKLEALKMSMLCSLVRRVDPPGVPAECGPGLKR